MKYGLAELDNRTGKIDWNINLPMDGVASGISIYEFLSSAAENDWELCGCFPCGLKGMKRALPGKAESVEYQEAAEVVSFVFKRL